MIERASVGRPTPPPGLARDCGTSRGMRPPFHPRTVPSSDPFPAGPTCPPLPPPSSRTTLPAMRASLGLALALWALVGCGTTAARAPADVPASPADAPCTPGTIAPCACPGTTGNVTCLPPGAWSMCECPPGDGGVDGQAHDSDDVGDVGQPSDVGCVPACSPGQVCMAGVCFAPVATDAGSDAPGDQMAPDVTPTSCYGSCSADSDCQTACGPGALSGRVFCCVRARCWYTTASCDGIRSEAGGATSDACSQLPRMPTWGPTCQTNSDCEACTPTGRTWTCSTFPGRSGVCL